MNTSSLFHYAVCSSSQASGPGLTHLIDAYCGSGLFALSAQHAKKFEACVGVETSESSVAQVNICMYIKACHYICLYILIHTSGLFALSAQHAEKFEASALKLPNRRSHRLKDQQVTHTHTHTDREQHPRHRNTRTRQEQHPKPPNEHLAHTLNNARR